ncbi:MAG: NAD-dependent deacetylase, partial [Candidatus Hermodarchaeota archaeon]
MSLGRRIELAAKWIYESRNLLVFTGAGISTDSGIPDYRGPNGVWTRKEKGLSPPNRISYDLVKPNESHYAIVELLKLGKLKWVISQNVDGLHELSGIPPNKLIELHGNRNYMICLNCGNKMTFKSVGWDKDQWGFGYRTLPVRHGQPNCPYCNGRIVSTIVNFGDKLPIEQLKKAKSISEECDVFFIIGSSLSVNPAANLVKIAKRNEAKLIILNDGKTRYDNIA